MKSDLPIKDLIFPETIWYTKWDEHAYIHFLMNKNGNRFGYLFAFSQTEKTRIFHRQVFNQPVCSCNDEEMDCSWLSPYTEQFLTYFREHPKTRLHLVYDT